MDVPGHEYFSYLGQKTQMEAANQAKVHQPPKIHFLLLIENDDAEKITNRSHSTRALEVAPVQRKREDRIESTSVMPGKNPPMVKLELFSQL